MTFAEKINILMISKDWSKADLASALGVSARTIENWLGGKSLAGKKGPAKAYSAIAEKTGCSIEWLKTGKGEPFPPNTSKEPDAYYTETERSLVDRLASRHGARMDLMVPVSEEEYDFLRLYRKIVAARQEAAKKAVKCLYDLMAEQKIERRKNSVDVAVPVKNGNTNGEAK